MMRTRCIYIKINLSIIAGSYKKDLKTMKTFITAALLAMSLTITSHSPTAWACENGADGYGGGMSNGEIGSGYGCHGGNGYSGIGYDSEGKPIDGGNGGAGRGGAGGGNGGNSQYGHAGNGGPGSCNDQGQCGPQGNLGIPG